MVPIYGTLVGGVVTCLALFLGGNVTAGHLDAKNMVEAFKAQASHAEKDDASDDLRLKADRDDVTQPKPSAPPGPCAKPAEPRTF